MEFFYYFFRFIYRIRWWLFFAPLIVTLIVIFSTRNMEQSYPVDMTIYTGIVSGYAMETGETNVQNSTIVNNTLDNIINIILSKETLHEVSLHLYARSMIYGDSAKDNNYIRAVNYRRLQRITPNSVKVLIDKTSEERTVENLKKHEKASADNFVYGLFNWNHPHYCYGALSQIKVNRLGNSDMLKITYSASDPGVAYQTLILLDQMYVKEYKTLQFGSTSSAIRYFEEELARVGKELKESEDSLTNYNIRNRIINYGEQTEQVAALDAEFDLRYQTILLNYNSANAAINHLESQLGENAKYMKRNSEFLLKLNQISDLSTKISEIEAFHTDTTMKSSYVQQRLSTYKSQLNEEEAEFLKFSNDYSNQKYTKEGYPTSNFVSLWLDELLKLERSKAEMKVLEKHKEDLDKRYSHYSPIGSTIKRQERSIDFIERSYLSFLTSLNAARLRLKSLEMNSASLKMINPPVFPLNSEPSKRKGMVMGAYAGSFIFLLGFFLLLDLLDRTLRDRVRTERIIGETVLSAFPGDEKLKLRKFSKLYKEKATQYLANSLQNYFSSENTVPIINFLSTEVGVGKSFLMDALAEYWTAKGIIINRMKYGEDFNPESPGFMFATGVREVTTVQNTPFSILLVEHAPLKETTIPKSFLQEATVNLFVVRADKSWEESDKQLFSYLKEQAENKPFFILLNRAKRDEVEGFTGMLPPYSFLRSRIYRYAQLGFTASGK